MIELNLFDLLPHRDAMLVLDKVFLDGEIAIGKKKFTGEEWFFRGHYPDNPIV
ncbi:MAG: beta-hydroxyacyl-ACP dehydratase, partial [Tissierellia bacterium]|nr:beta-hydroxyacyl-ACP dehydratase [Tissierellia bacterium]